MVGTSFLLNRSYIRRVFKEEVFEKVDNYVFIEFDLIVTSWPMCLCRATSTTDRQ